MLIVLLSSRRSPLQLKQPTRDPRCPVVHRGLGITPLPCGRLFDRHTTAAFVDGTGDKLVGRAISRLHLGFGGACEGVTTGR